MLFCLFVFKINTIINELNVVLRERSQKGANMLFTHITIDNEAAALVRDWALEQTPKDIIFTVINLPYCFISVSSYIGWLNLAATLAESPKVPSV